MARRVTTPSIAAPVFPFVHAAVAAFVLAGGSGCDSPPGERTDSAPGGRAIVPGSLADGVCAFTSVEPREDAIGFTHVARLGGEGPEPGPGFLTGASTISDIVRDAQGRYWIGQDTEIKVFGPDGEFVTTVGRVGEGPMEFGRVHPFHLDSEGHVHVYDLLKRISVIGEDFELVREMRFAYPGITMAPLDDGVRYLFAAAIQAEGSAGLPLHVLDDADIVQSFGIVAGQDSVTDYFTAERWLSTNGSWDVFAVPFWDYVIESWTEGGTRSGRLEGPDLDDGLRTPDGSWSLENPPWNRVRDLKITRDGRLWVIVQIRQEDWRDHATEVTRPDGTTSLQLPLDDPAALYRSRLDVFDPVACTLLGSRWFDGEGVLSGFVDGATVEVSELFYGRFGDPLLNVWDVELR